MLELLASTFFTLLVVMDPVGLIPAFLGLAGSRPSQERLQIVRKACIVAGSVILVFALVGATMLEKLGISIAAFRASGGVLLFLIALDMVFARPSGAKETKDEETEAQTREDISVFPLAIPLIAGPGTLASVMIQVGKMNNQPQGIFLVVAVAGVVLLLCYMALRAAGAVIKVIGRTGVNVVTRVLGVLLAALAVQYIADGTRVLLGLPQ